MKCAVSRYEAFPGSVLPKLLLVCATLGLVGGCSAASAEADAEAAGDDAKRIVLISGPSGYPAGVHEYNAGVAFLSACLDEVPGVESVAHINGWPADPGALDGADAILMFMNGGGGHEILRDGRMAQVRELMAADVGLGAIHYAMDVPADRGGAEFLDWLGGYYETNYSVNPLWTAHFEEIPEHPVTRGVTPFALRDEWYFSIRFREDMEGITPILQARPSDETRDGPYNSPPGPFPHIVAAKGQLETVAWVRERPDGGRGFGYTGAHLHENWNDPNARTVVLNALLWIAGADVPAEGASCSVRAEDVLGMYPKQ